MRFHIYSDKFERTAQYSKSKETIPLKALETKKNFFLPLKAERILNYTDEDIELDEISRDFPAEEKEAFLNAIILMECFGAAEILREATDPAEPVIRVAGEKDYRQLADFYKENDSKLGFNQDSLRAWQFNNLGYSFIYKAGKEIKAALAFEIPDAETASKTLNLIAVVFSKELCNESKEEIFKDLFRHALKDFKGEFLRVRYIAVKGMNEYINDILISEGFANKGELKAETLDKKDVLVFDKDIE